MNIERTVKKLSGVSEAQVNFAAEQAAVAFDPGKLPLKDMVENAPTVLPTLNEC